MRVTSAVVLAIIAGILSSASAQSADTILESWCVKNGGPTAWASVQTSAQNTRNCMASVVFELMEEFQNTGNDMNAVLAVYCGKVDILINCFRSLAESLEPCLDLGHQKRVNISMDTTASMLQFTCANINLVKGVLESPDRQCLMSKGPALENCRDKIVTNSSTTSPDLPVTEINPHEILPEPEPVLDSQICNNILAAEQCSIKVLEECEDKIFSTTLDSMYKYVNNDIPCENLPKSPKSESSTNDGVVNIL